ncbi:MAG: hypothetical protein FWE74_05825 [Oscillospiraceae bacterium]|nr:hypothetical protein [Oscillospiraceae bacterium]
MEVSAIILLILLGVAGLASIVAIAYAISELTYKPAHVRYRKSRFNDTRAALERDAEEAKNAMLRESARHSSDRRR